MRISIVILALLSFAPAAIHGWTIHVPTTSRSPVIERRPSSLVGVGGRARHHSSLLASSPDPYASSLLLAEESWRQYVPLVVSAIVIIDILLGSPVLNLIVAPMKRQAEGNEQDDDNNVGGGMFATMSSQQPKVNPKERIDSEQVAQEALDKARNSLELQQFLDAQKDPIQEARKNLDQQMAEVDETLEKRKLQEE